MSLIEVRFFDEKITKKDIKKIFRKYGPIKEIIFNQSSEEKSNGNAMVRYYLKNSAFQAYERNQTFIGSHKVEINIIHAKKRMKPEEIKKFIFSFSDFLVITLITIISALSHFPNIGKPNDVLLEESFTGKFINDLLNNKRTFDINPPLGKMILAYYAKNFCGYKGMFSFGSTMKYIVSKNIDYIKVKVLPCLCCTLVAPFITASMILMNCSLLSSFTSGFLFAVDFEGIVQGRMITVDSILYLFVALTIFFSSLYRRKGSYIALLFEMFFAGCAFCTKFSGITAVIYALISVFNTNVMKKGFAEVIRHLVFAVFILVSSVLIIMDAYLHLTPEEGSADKYLDYRFRRQPFITQSVTLLNTMIKYNLLQTVNDPYVSKWYNWPFFVSAPNVIWSQNYNSEIIALFNNPVSALMALFGVVTCLFTGRIRWILSYFAILPFILQKNFQRLTFYEVPMIFGLCSLAFSLDHFSSYVSIAFSSSLIIGAFVAFVIWMPWAYGIAMSVNQFKKTLVWSQLYEILK